MNDLKPIVWRALFASDDVPESNLEYLQRIYESSFFGGTATNLNEQDLVRSVLGALGEDVDDDVVDYIDNGTPTTLFDEAVLASIERADAEPAASISEDDEGEEEPGEESLSPVDATPLMMGLDTLYQMIRHGQLDLNPPWQRDVVWSPAKQKELIKSILLGIPIPSIILHLQNPGKLGKERYSIIDGKQRLTAIRNFIENNFKLPPYRVEPDHPLFPARSCYYDATDKGKKRLPPTFRSKITTTQIPVLQFRDVSERRLREVFNLYNVTAVRLNAAEIRNAIYQHNAIHQMLFILAGEGAKGMSLPYVDDADQAAFRTELARVLPSVKRFASVAFLCRYLGYSRAAGDEGKAFRAITTREAINRYFDIESPKEDVAATCREVMAVFRGAQDLFDLEPDDDDRPIMAFFRRTKGKRKFEALQATTSMVCARILLAALEEGVVSQDEVYAAVRSVASREEYPEKQQYVVIWDYQARMVLGLAAELGIDLDALSGGRFRAFHARMVDARMKTQG